MRRRSGRICGRATRRRCPGRRSGSMPAVGSWMRAIEAREGRLAAARLADEPDGLAAPRRRDRRRRPRARPAAWPKKPSFGSGKCFTRPRTVEQRLPRPSSPAWLPAARARRGASPARGRRRRQRLARSCVTQQRALRPGATRQQLGMLVALLDAERTARARNGSPSARSSGSGGVPSMVVSRLSPGRCRSMPRHRVDQRPGIGMARIGEQLLRSAPPPPPRRHTSRSRAGRHWR